MKAQLEGRAHLINLLDLKDSRNTILHLACEHHHPTLVTWLLQQQPTLMVNVTNQEGKSAFFVACEKGFTEVVKAMLLAIPSTQPLLDVNAGSKHHSPLMIACKGGHIGVVKEILERAGDKVDVNRVRSGSVLTNACDSGNMEILEMLLSHPKIDVNQKIDKGSTLTHHVSHHNQLPQLRRLLQIATLNLNQQTDLGMTPLMTGCQQGSSYIASELMKFKNVNPNLCDSRKRTVLWFAAKKRNMSLFLSILCTPNWVVDTATKPEDEEYPKEYTSYLKEYAKNPTKFQEKYGGGSHSGKLLSAIPALNFFFFLFLSGHVMLYFFFSSYSSSPPSFLSFFFPTFSTSQTRRKMMLTPL